MRSCLIALAATLFASACSAQTKYEIGLEAGLTNSLYKINDAGNNLTHANCFSWIGAANFRMNSKNNFFYEAALMVSKYAVCLKLKQEIGYSSDNSDQVIMLALRSGYKINLGRRTSIAPVVGIAGAYKLLNEESSLSSFSTNTAGSTSTTIFREHRTRPLNQDFFPLLQGGLQFGWRLARGVKACFGVDYYQGLTTHKIFDVNYRINNGPTQTATMEGRGSFMNYNAGVKFLF